MTSTKTEVKTSPTPEEATTLITHGIKQSNTITIFGECEVQYDGRAASYLGPGDRLIILKPDGTLLVHAYDNHKPRNWQPPGCVHTCTVDRGDTYITSIRKNPAETINIRFSTVHTVQRLSMDDDEELTLWGSEEDLKQRVLDNPDLIEPGFIISNDEYTTDAGEIDIFGEDANNTPTVVELKRSNAGVEAVRQLRSYVDALYRETTHDHIRGIIGSTGISDRSLQYLHEEGFEHVELEPRKPTNTDFINHTVASQQQTFDDMTETQ